MKKFLKIISLLLIISLILVGCSTKTENNNKTVEDIADKAFKETIDLTGINKDKVSKEEQGKRIVMDSVALSQLAEKLDLNLAGVPSSRLGKMPKRYDDVIQIGLPMNPNMEVLKAIKPTMVYSPDSLADWLKEGFEKNNIPHKFVNMRSVDSLYSLTKELATTYNRMDKYTKLEEDKNNFFKDYNAKIKDKKRPKVLILMGLPGSYIVATSKSYVGNLVALSGAENIAQETGEEFVQMNMESYLAKNPDYILRTAHAMPDVVGEMFKAEFKNNKSWQHFRAVKENKVIDLNSSIFGMTAQFDYTKGLDDLYNIFYK